MNREIFVVDHDGFLTDPLATHEIYTDIYEAELAEKINIPVDTLHQVMEKAREDIRAKPKMYAWEREGYKIAPATVDTFVLNGVEAKLVLEDLQNDGGIRLPEDTKGIDKLLEEVYLASYPGVNPTYRAEAAQFITNLNELGKLIIVSNSNRTHLLELISKPS